MAAARRFGGSPHLTSSVAAVFSTLMGMAGTLLSLPLVARGTSAAEWGSFGVAQVTGSILGSCLAFSWPILGITLSARAAVENLPALNGRALRERVVLLVALLPPVVLVLHALMDVYLWEGVAVAVGTGIMIGLSNSWLFLGRGDSRGQLLFEAVPALGGALAAGACVLVTRDVWTYGLMLGLARLASLAGQTRFGYGYDLDRTHHVDELSLRDRFGVALTQIAGSAYASAPVLIAGAMLDPVGRAAYVGADKVYKPCTSLLGAVLNPVQGWVSAASPEDRGARTRSALVAFAALGAAGGAAIAFLGRPAAHLLFGGQPVPGPGVFVWLGVAFFVVGLSSWSGRLLLVPSGLHRVLLPSVLASLVVGVVGMVGLGRLYGTNGIAAGFAASTVVVVLGHLLGYAVARRHGVPAETGLPQPVG